MQSIVSKVSMPTLHLQNVPEDVSADALTKAFVAQAPKSIHISGSNTVRVKKLNTLSFYCTPDSFERLNCGFSVQVTVPNSQEAFDAIVALRKVQIGGQSLKVPYIQFLNCC